MKKIATSMVLGLGALLALAACDGGSNTGTGGSGGSAGEGGAAGGTAGGGAGGSGGVGGGAGGDTGALEVQSHVSPDGFVVNSHLVVGETEAVLVDGQLFSAEAEKVVSLVQRSGKDLTTVFLTHAHPDHYIGMEVIRSAFPGAKFVTTAAVLADYNAKKDGTLAYLQANFPGMVPDKVVDFAALDGTSIKVDGHTLDVVEITMAGESEVAATIAIKELNALITGDLVYSKAHLWTAECNLAGWSANLDAVGAMGYETYYPGHGAAASAAVLAEDKQYLAGVEPILKAAATAEEAIGQIKAKYPDWTGDGLLQLATTNYFAPAAMGGCK